MSEGFEFWSSVEYGTFLKGLVRELCAQGAKEECRVQKAEVLPEAKPEAALSPPGEGAGPLGGGASASGLTSEYGGRRTEDGANHLSLDATSSWRGGLRSSGSAAQRFAVAESDYRQARGTLARLRMRWRCYVGYPLLLRRRVRREGAPLALVVCTNTFYAPWVAMRAARKKGIPVVHWMFDLFPDVLVLAGKLKPGSLGERWLRRWVRAMFDGASANVFLGDKLLAYAETQFGPIPRAVVIPVGCDAMPFAGCLPAARNVGRKARPTMSENGGDADGGDKPRPTIQTGPVAAEVRVLYCGNFGRMHEVDTVVGALRGGVPAGVQLDFRGNGAGFQVLAAAVRDLGLGERMRLGGSLPEAEWLDAMAAADVALVSMKKGAEGIVMPSKTYSAMAAGQAILAVCPRESDLADTVTKHDCGWVIEPGDVAGLRALLESLPARAEEVLQKRKNAWQAARDCYDQRVLAGRWSELLAELRPPSDK